MSTAVETLVDAELERQVADYLRAHPDFFDRHAELLAALRIPHGAGKAVSLVERQLGLLRGQSDQLRARLPELPDARQERLIAAGLRPYDAQVLTEEREVRDRPQAAPDEALDFLRASRLLAFGRLAPRARVRRARQHAVLGGQPALPGALEERRHALLDARRAQHLGLADGDQHRALRVAREAARDAYAAQFVGAAAGRTGGHG